MWTAKKIASTLGAGMTGICDPDAEIRHITTDTRRVETPSTTLFFALSGSLHDGHAFIHDAIDRGIKNIVVERDPGLQNRHVNVFLVPDSLKALQTLAARHRASFPDICVVGITGSNGKTTIKEWLYQMIQDKQVVKSPKSYNSQTGVALSVWQIREGDQLGLFEAGISRLHEMENLQRILMPQIGLFTMLGDAHAEGFASLTEKLNEKLILFKNAATIIFEEDDLIVSMAIREMYSDKNLLSWGWNKNASLFRIIDLQKSNYQSRITIEIKGETHILIIPFSDAASIENALHCVATMLVIQYAPAQINEALKKIQIIPMRLEMKNGLHASILINDTYNADIQSLKIALEFLSQQSGAREKVVILSDFMQTGLDETTLNHRLAGLIQNHNITHLIGVGTTVASLEKHIDPFILFSSYATTEELLQKLPSIDLAHKAILVKGARKFRLERIVTALSEKAHTAVLETDLQSVENNLRFFSQKLSAGTKLIAVIKASAYGSGSEELARFLEFRKVGYLAVAFIDEGIQLRKAGVMLPVIILNPDRNGVLDMIRYDLEPEVYSLEQLREINALMASGEQKPFNIHLKVDTGMHRLGFMPEDMEDLCRLIGENRFLHVSSVFSHLSSSEDPGDDDFTHQQVTKLNQHFDFIATRLGYKPMKHILNSAGIIRFPEYHFDLVRLGLGLYGIDTTETIGSSLEKVHTLKATVVQLKHLNKDEFVGYNRKGIKETPGMVAIINIGYADGLMRRAGNGRYLVRINGQDYPIIGNVCMDLTIIDIGRNNGIKVGDEVFIFGKDKPVEDLAVVCETIPYEILSRISGRVKRLYIQG